MADTRAPFADNVHVVCLFFTNQTGNLTEHPFTPTIMTTRLAAPERSLLGHSIFELRCLLEAATLPWALPWLLRAPKGDGHPVILLPGFMASELTMGLHELFLRNRGYDVSHWGFGRNIGFQPKHAKAVEQKIRYLHHKTGRKVSLVGWSLGGVFALHGARQAPECVRSVITLGSPIRVDQKGERSVPRWLKAMYRLVAHPMGPIVHESQLANKLGLQGESLPMPLSCLYGVGDGVVTPHEATIGGNSPHHEYVRVPASHLGMGVNPMVLWIVADRLAQAEGDWAPFAPTGASAYAYRLLTHAMLPI